MTSYIYILIKYFVVILILVLLFKYTNILSFDNSTIVLIFVLIIIPIIIDVMFSWISSQDSHNKETFNNHSIAIPKSENQVVDYSNIQFNVNNLVHEKIADTIKNEPSKQIDKPNTIDRKIRIDTEDDKLFDNYKFDYYEEGLENSNIHQNKFTENIDGEYANIYNMYMKNCYKASLE